MNWIYGAIAVVSVISLIAWWLSRNPRLKRLFKWSFWGLAALLIFSFLHYTLPQTDIVRIVGANTKRIDFGENSFFWSGPEVGNATDGVTRDIFFIETIQPNGRPLVYRNEDTGWGWPPYFKLNSFNLQATASSLISTAEAPKWVAVQHYGWRNEFFTIFPNALSLRQVEGPDVRIIPWASIIILTLLALLVILIWRMLAQFRERMIDPMVESVGDRIEEIDAAADQARDRARSRWTAWIDSWRGKPRR